MVDQPPKTFHATVLLTRPERDSKALGAPLQEHGVRVISNPLLRICEKPIITPPAHSPAAWILTSRYAVSALKALESDKTKPIFTVGKPTATVCHNAGFTHVIAGDGHAKSLLDVITRSISNNDFNSFIHLSGDVVRYDLAKHLQEKGYNASRLIVYESQPILSFHRQTLDLLKAQDITHVLFFSPRTAAIFASLIKEHTLEKTLTCVCAIGMSQEIVAELRTLTWARTIVAQNPQTALLEDIGKE